MAAAALSSRAVLKIAGADAVPFLQGIVTQDVEAAKERAVFSALLTPQGKILFDFFLVPYEGGFLLDCAASAADALQRRLTLYRLRAAVTIERLADWRVVAAASLAPGAGAVVFNDPRLAALGMRALALGAASAEDEAAYDQRRVALGVPEFGKDFGADEMFLLDVNYDALNAASYRKGCFVGQEVTSRMKRKGEIRKRTALLRFEGPPPPKGAPVVAGDSTLGEVLSGTDGAALTLLRLDRLKGAAAEIVAGEKPVRVEIPPYLETA